MASLAVVKSIGIIAFSFISGFLYYYIALPYSKRVKKKQVEEMFSLLVNFIIYIWIGKIIAKGTVFIKDPLAVLAYPSHAYALYIAILLIIINIIYKKWRTQLDTILLLKSFFPVYLAASFMYEFLQLVLEGNRQSLMYLGLLFVLLIVVTMSVKVDVSVTYTIILLLTLTLGQLILTLMIPYMTVFGYTIAPWFFIAVISGLFIVSWFIYKRKV